MKTLFKLFGAYWFLAVLANFAFAGAIVYVAWHFIAKFW